MKIERLIINNEVWTRTTEDTMKGFQIMAKFPKEKRFRTIEVVQAHDEFNVTKTMVEACDKAEKYKSSFYKTAEIKVLENFGKKRIVWEKV